MRVGRSPSRSALRTSGVCGTSCAMSRRSISSCSRKRLSMPRLVFEIGCEELPAAACMEAGLQLPELVREHLGAHPLELFIGPRRLAFPVDVPERTADEWIKGPPENLREKAAAGFAKKHGVTVDDLTLRDGFLGVEVPGRPIAAVLPQRLAAIVTELQLGKPMDCGAGYRFSRPVRWVCAKLQDPTV